MNDEARNIDPEADAQPEPSIPDGGLAEAMPDWLRRPPAWRGMPVPDVPPPDPVAVPAPTVEVEAAMPEAATTAARPRELPPPDTAPIDPSSLIDLDDLPEWLVSLGRRARPSLSPDAERARAMADAEAPPTQTPADEPDIPLPPSLRSDEPSPVATRASAPAANGGALFGMSRPLLGLALVLVVVVVVAILLSVFG